MRAVSFAGVLAFLSSSARAQVSDSDAVPDCIARRSQTAMPFEVEGRIELKPNGPLKARNRMRFRWLFTGHRLVVFLSAKQALMTLNFIPSFMAGMGRLTSFLPPRGLGKLKLE